MLDRAAPLPLWAQLLADLRRRLAAGEFDEVFPTDADLTADYGVSRQTVREAVGRLAAEGVLERQRGRRTAIRDVEFEQPLGSFYSLFQEIEAQGVAQENIVRVLEERVDPTVADQLGLRRNEPLVYLERLRLAGGRPLALDRTWLPARVARPLLGVDFRRTAFYEELARRCGVRPSGGREQIRPVVPRSGDRELLGLSPADAAFAVERMCWGEGRPLELRHSLVRGDRYGFVAEWGEISRSARAAGGD
jgi:GntR family transcriptional regulator